MFALVDGCSDGTTAEDDRKVSPEEWCASLDAMQRAGASWAPFEALQSVGEGTFGDVDEDGKGAILLIEFCKWIERAEIDAETAMGQDLAIGDDDEDVAS